MFSLIYLINSLSYIILNNKTSKLILKFKIISNFHQFLQIRQEKIRNLTSNGY